MARRSTATVSTNDDHIEIIGSPDARVLAGAVTEGDDGTSVTDLVSQPAKVMRIGTMIKQLLEEV
ncbi:MAG TPA: DUF2587 domain-containing protein, partial [Mycolicibacterium fallax]|nr:DUF2587 domain-containing protein [Mycolicibacterium fallax]